MSEQTANNKQFELQRIYLKDVSFETPNSPQIFLQEWKPKIDLQLGTEANRLDEGVYEVVLKVTVTNKVGENTAFLAEVEQAGIFILRGFADNEMAQMLGSYCPNVLFPYAREAVSDLVTKGSFPQFLLAPVNFDALLAQHIQEQQAKQQGESDGAPTAPETSH
ncbi:MAG: protein-export chaperone SecB [Gammaproteobacteria bacterium SHHR-1]|uniref:protein-export chaperone SecB n=1 Tax=Magnetovirga frankeli TaxID=947516 RepID=UPI001292F3BB|nr:protein-export chaperone SecB [gamma proteobacterium SS-5]